MSEVFYVKEGILSLKEMHEEKNPLKLIKWHCKYNCCAGVEKEWKECNNISCPLWVMRLGKNPNRKKRTITEEQKERFKERMKEVRKK